MKKVDLIVFGATGFTGAQTAKFVDEIAPRYGLTWAIAGRDIRKIKELSERLDLKPETTIIADALDLQSVRKMVAQGKALINLAGPYAVYGPNVVAACAEAGVHYADLSGELLFVKDMIRKHDARARESGAIIMPCCGYESLPFDLGSALAASRYRERFGRNPERVDCLTRFQFAGRFLYPSDGLSGGTWGSAVNMMASEDVNGVTDPLFLLDGDTDWLPAESRKYSVLGNVFSRQSGWKAPMIPIPWLNPAVIYRSQQIARNTTNEAGYLYREGVDFSGFFPGDRLLKPFISIGLSLGVEAGEKMMKLPVSKPRKALSKLLRVVGPRPGDGPAPERLDLWNYFIDFTATGGQERAASAHIEASGHPGYKSTADIIGMTGLLLAGATGTLSERGGLMTPSTGLGLGSLREFNKARLVFS